MIIEKPYKWKSIQFDILNDVVKWEVLREWSLSNVHRITLTSGKTMIAKWSGGNMIRETDIYNNLLAPLKIERPIINENFKSDQGTFTIMEDIGKNTLEHKPLERYYMLASQKLAKLHDQASKNIQKGYLSNDRLQHYSISENTFIEELLYLKQHSFFSNHEKQVINKLTEIFPKQIKNLYHESTPTLIHNDYYPKNLIVADEQIKVIDWSNAYISNHLGDLYGLIKEAKHLHFCPDSILQAYYNEIKERNYSLTELYRNVQLGGLCWYIHSITWVLDYGRSVITGSENWIKGMITNIKNLIE
ncbi:phosphotransferase [Chengkuizengella axinellae]|uniref:Phosphotransferase n=1 Tax=Chengkuizengella axinellae TaxID=3064388 RepID=A0ABT9IWY7_9BACL|nr:phosphotransferase [Chengkuizengella sp. 2205SS18-9]MDP5273862.1 phosphotransferase [Chengkuizengella sp. 2205SS18-9]